AQLGDDARAERVREDLDGLGPEVQLGGALGRAPGAGSVRRGSGHDMHNTYAYLVCTSSMHKRCGSTSAQVRAGMRPLSPRFGRLSTRLYTGEVVPPGAFRLGGTRRGRSTGRAAERHTRDTADES